MDTDTKIMHIGSSAATFIRSQIRKLDLSDDEKISSVMIASAITAAVFISAFIDTSGESQISVMKNYIQSIEEILRQIKQKQMN